MIQINGGYSSYKKKKVSLDILAEEHYDRVVGKNGTYVSPLTNLKNEIEKAEAEGKSALHIKFLKKVADDAEFKKLIISPLKEFPNLIDDYKEFEDLFKEKTYKEYLELFGYSRLRNLRLMYTFALDLGIKTCPYCNNLYVLTIKKSKKANLHFDHFYAKSIYPFLSLSYFNLIPCCAICNTAKGDAKFLPTTHTHPYLDAFSDKFEFATDEKSIIDMIIKGDRDFSNLKVQLKVKRGYESIFKNHDDAFNLSDVYNEHKDVIFEVYSKQYIYTDSFINSIKKQFGGQFKDHELDRFLLGNYTLESEINNRPLAKLMQDIHKDAKKARQ